MNVNRIALSKAELKLVDEFVNASAVKEVMEDGGLYIPENVPENRNKENLIVEFYFAFSVSHFAK